MTTADSIAVDECAVRWTLRPLSVSVPSPSPKPTMTHAAPGSLADEKAPGSPRPSNLSSPGGTPASASAALGGAAATVRPSFSFASAAAGKKDAAPQSADAEPEENAEPSAEADTNEVTDKLGEVTI